MLKSKLHRAKVTDSDLNYEGSIGIDRDWMDEVGLLPYEQVDVASIANGARFTTYVIEEERGSEKIVINGAAAHLVNIGDLVIIMGYCVMSDGDAQQATPKIKRLE